MSKNNGESLDNAIEIIEKFGGIRPMSSKTDIPVTTIQGWKKRNTIPAGRVDEIIEAARKNNIDLSTVIGNGANENDIPAETVTLETTPIVEGPGAIDASAQAPVGEFGDDKAPAFLEAESKSAVDAQDKEFAEALAAVEKKAIGKSAAISLVIVAIVVGGAALLVGPKFTIAPKEVEAVERNVENLETEVGIVKGDVADVIEEQSFIRKMIPDQWEAEAEELRSKAAELQEQGIALKNQVGDVIKQAEAVSSDVLGAEAGDLDQRLSALQMHIDTMGGSGHLAALIDKLRAMQMSGPGREYLSQVTNGLSQALAKGQSGGSGLVGEVTPEALVGDAEMDMNALLDAARQSSPVLDQTFENVPKEDMKAAAMLFAMNQFRGAMNRDKTAFSDDLGLLKSMVGEDNAALNEALDRLAPHAESGVLTLGGLSDEFRSMAGEAVVSSLKGEDVSLQEKAKARMNEIFAVEKDGELLTGTDTQAKLVKAEKALDEGKLDEAVATVQSLEPEAKAPLRGWLNEAQATLRAHEAEEKLKLYVEKDVELEGGRFVHYPEYDMYIYEPRVETSEPMAAPVGSFEPVEDQ